MHRRIPSLPAFSCLFYQVTMRFQLAVSLFLASVFDAEAFTASHTRWGTKETSLFSTTNSDHAVEIKQATQQGIRTADIDIDIADIFPMPETRDEILPLTADEINSRLNQQMVKLQAKDQTSKQLCREDLQIVYQDEDIVVVDKPSGVLTVAGKGPNPNIAQTVFDSVKADLPSADHMVVHRLGFETSGMLVFAKSKAAVRGMNAEFRERKVRRLYEALVVGHIEKDEGMISLPIMRDYEFPPYVRISTDEHQRALLNLDPDDVGKKILELPKASITKYQVVGREYFNGLPVTRVTLTSISGRYHQLNVHMAAFGHPIVGDNIYGYNGEAVSNGGLTDDELRELVPNPNRADDSLQASIAVAAKGMSPCVHAKYLGFRHPVSRNYVEFSTDSPF